jgi:hypothetical protein
MGGPEAGVQAEQGVERSEQLFGQWQIRVGAGGHDFLTRKWVRIATPYRTFASLPRHHPAPKQRSKGKGIAASEADLNRR